MRAICCDTLVCTPRPWSPKPNRAYECGRCGRVWTYRFDRTNFSGRWWELTRTADTDLQSFPIEWVTPKPIAEETQ